MNLFAEMTPGQTALIALTPVLVALGYAAIGWIQWQMKKSQDLHAIHLKSLEEKFVESDKKLVGVAADIEAVKVHTNSITSQLNAKTDEAAVNRTLIEERGRVESAAVEKARVEAEVQERIRLSGEAAKLVANGSGTSVVSTAIEENVIETGKDVKAIKKDTGEIHNKVVEEVRSGVAEAVKDAKDRL
jgi:hypothetical protein